MCTWDFLRNHRDAHLEEAPQYLGRSKDAPRTHDPVTSPHAFQKFGHIALWPFCASVSPPLKDKWCFIIPPPHPPTRTKCVTLLALLRGDKQCQWKLLPIGEQFLFTYVVPTPCRNAGCPWPGWVIRRMSQATASTLCQRNRFAACFEDKSFSRGKPWHGSSEEKIKRERER